MSHDLDAFMRRHEHLTGDARIDTLHEEFYALLQALREAPREQAADALLALITHTREHFAHEDDEMTSGNYPIRECHIDEHAEVMTSLVQVHERLCQDDHSALPRLVQAPPGMPVGSLVARGEVALGFQQLAELIHLQGIAILGPMPAAVQITTTPIRNTKA